MRTTSSALMLSLMAAPAVVTQAPEPAPRRLLAVGMSAGFQHESVSDALAMLYQLGRESGLWETTIRTDVQLITRKELERNGKNLEYFDAVFFVTSGELPLDEEQKAALISFVREDGKAFLAAHSATTSYEWSDYGEMIGGYFDGHPWGETQGRLNVEDQNFAAMRHLPPSFEFFDEFYQIRGFDRKTAHVLMSLDTSSVDMDEEGVKYTDVPVAWTREHGLGRVFYSSLGHGAAVWARDDVREMWLEAVKWGLRIDD